MSEKPNPRKTDTISIEVRGPKKFRQALMDLIYEALMDEDIFIESAKPGCGYNLTSTIEPSDRVMG